MEMKKIAITTDTNSGMTPHENEADGIFVLPMPFIVDGVQQLESVDLSREEFYAKLKSDSSVSTSQPSVGELTEFWTNILKEYDQIVHIPTSSLLSNSCASAQALAKEFDGKVYVVDNHRISISLKSSVFDAATLRSQGKSAEEIKTVLEESYADYAIYFSLVSMQYLKKGGRISPAAAAIGSILKLRPVLCLKGEKLEKFSLPRTQIKAKDIMIQAIKKELTTRLKKYADNGEITLAVTHAENEEEAEKFVEELKKFFPTLPVEYCDPLSLSIACHTGPGTLAIAALRRIK